MVSVPDFQRYRPIIDDWEAFTRALERPLPRCIWANLTKTTPSELESHLAEESIAFEPISWRPGAYRLPDCHHPGSRFGYVAGLYQVQEEASMLPVSFMDTKPGLRILDLCAAPGSKTTLLAANEGRDCAIVANDRNYHRMAPLARSIDRLGLPNISLLTEDGTNLPNSIGTFDRILVDAPCSGEGTSRKTRDISAASAQDFHRLCSVQRALLKRALELSRPGARVVYSTCTYAPEENEAIVDDILTEFGDAWTLAPARLEGFSGAPGLLRWEQHDFDPQLRNALRVYPHHGNTGGFFIAVLVHQG